MANYFFPDDRIALILVSNTANIANYENPHLIYSPDVVPNYQRHTWRPRLFLGQLWYSPMEPEIAALYQFSDYVVDVLISSMKGIDLFWLIFFLVVKLREYVSYHWHQSTKLFLPQWQPIEVGVSRRGFWGTVF